MPRKPRVARKKEWSTWVDLTVELLREKKVMYSWMDSNIRTLTRPYFIKKLSELLKKKL